MKEVLYIFYFLLQRSWINRIDLHKACCGWLVDTTTSWCRYC